MQNFDVQHNVACKQSAISCVDNVLSFVTTGRHVVLCFQCFVQHLDQTLENVVEKVFLDLQCFFLDLPDSSIMTCTKIAI